MSTRVIRILEAVLLSGTLAAGGVQAAFAQETEAAGAQTEGTVSSDIRTAKDVTALLGSALKTAGGYELSLTQEAEASLTRKEGSEADFSLNADAVSKVSYADGFVWEGTFKASGKAEGSDISALCSAYAQETGEGGDLYLNMSLNGAEGTWKKYSVQQDAWEELKSVLDIAENQDLLTAFGHYKKFPQMSSVGDDQCYETRGILSARELGPVWNTLKDAAQKTGAGEDKLALLETGVGAFIGNTIVRVSAKDGMLREMTIDASSSNWHKIAQMFPEMIGEEDTVSISKLSIQGQITPPQGKIAIPQEALDAE